jgi:formamidopyrimidine-DNA glycosylase
MFELPEMVNFAGQMNKMLKGRSIKKAVMGNTPHKFVWYNKKHREFEKLTRGKKIGNVHAQGRWLFIALDPGYVLVIGEFGGRMLFHQAGAGLPKKYHLYLLFQDASFFTATTQMWGAIELYEKGKEKTGKYVRGMKATPVQDDFTLTYFNSLIDDLKENKSAKGILTQDQLIPGLGNAIAQDILFYARLHPRHAVKDLTMDQRKKLYRAIKRTVDQVIKKGGRYDEYDLLNKPGNYIRLMDKNTAGKACSQCGTRIKKIQYLGGACYFCPKCQI